MSVGDSSTEYWVWLNHRCYLKTVGKRNNAESPTGTGEGELLLAGAVGVEGGALRMVGPDVAGEGDAAAAGAVSDRSVVRVEEGLLDRGGKVGDVVADRVGGGVSGAHRYPPLPGRPGPRRLGRWPGRRCYDDCGRWLPRQQHERRR